MQTPLMIYSDLYDRNDDKNSKNMQMTLVFMVKSAKVNTRNSVKHPKWKFLPAKNFILNA